MDTLESKLDRMSPEQRKETEDFVDFLLSRSGEDCISLDVSRGSPPALRNALPPHNLIEPVKRGETLLPQLQVKVSSNDRTPPMAGNEGISASFHEISGGIQDRISHDYMEYGQFESRTTPANEASKKVKRKIIAQEGLEKSHHLLDWVG